MITRKEIRTLNPDELLKFRMAMEVIQEKGLYNELAGYHGNPKHYCPHSKKNVLFLAWHRYYIYLLEQQLIKVDDTVSLPYWDWTDEATFKDVLAPAHKDLIYTNPTGVKKNNPLLFAFAEDHKTKTTRRTRNPSVFNLNKAKKSVSDALKNSGKLQDLNNGLYGPHATIHTEIGGSFGSVSRAAFDPLFWSHHATVDRQWAIWQEKNQHVEIPNISLGKPFENITVNQVLNYKTEFGYNYDNLNFSYDSNPKPVILSIIDIITTGQAISVDVFLIKPNTEQKVKAASFGIFGMKDMNTQHHHHVSTFDEFLDITEAVDEMDISLNEIDPQKYIQFEALDEDGNKLNPDMLRFEKIFIERRG